MDLPRGSRYRAIAMRYRIELSSNRNGFARINIPGRVIEVEAAQRMGAVWQVKLTEPSTDGPGAVGSGAVTVTRTAPPKVVTRTVPGAPSLPCQDIGGSPEPGVITPGLPGDTTCTVTLDSPMGASHLAQITLTAPNGDAAIWNLANPNG